MERLSRDQALMEMALVIAKRGTCSRLQVGVVFARDGRVVSMGYNGAPSGMAHCNHECDCGGKANMLGTSHTLTCRGVQPCTTAEHAERNAIAFAARHGVALKGSTMYVTHMPCASCAMSIINAGIDEVVYKYPYRLVDGVHLLEQAGVAVIDTMGDLE